MTKLKIRRIQARDFLHAARVWHRASTLAEEWLPAPALPRATDRFRQLAARRGVWVAIRAGQVVGVLALAPRTIDQLCVDPDFWSQGIGSALLQRAGELMPEGFGLFTDERNARARRFYEKRGLVARGRGISTQGRSRIRYETEQLS